MAPVINSIAMIGLGRMGGNMAKRLARAGIRVHGFDAAQATRDEFASLENIQTHASLEATVAALPATGSKLVWVMLPAGEITDKALEQLMTLTKAGDVVVNGGNCNYLVSQAQGAQFAAKGIHFSDCGVSGGIWGLENGYCVMYGASDEGAKRLAPIMQALAPTPSTGWIHCGPVGSGHFAKMIHNGMEYGMMQAMAEGFSLLEGKKEFNFDLGALAEAWRHGSVVRSWLLDLTATALQKPGSLEEVAPFVSDSGEGRWTIDEAIRQGTPAPAIALALMSRFDSQGKADTANKILSLMRKGFGGHAVKKAD